MEADTVEPTECDPRSSRATASNGAAHGARGAADQEPDDESYAPARWAALTAALRDRA